MPTTRYGVRVGLNPSKRYTVQSSAAPILSQQKRYGVQIENRLVITKTYGFTLPHISLRYAQAEDGARARRAEREHPASLFVPDAANAETRFFAGMIEQPIQAAAANVFGTVIDPLNPSHRYQETDATRADMEVGQLIQDTAGDLVETITGQYVRQVFDATESGINTADRDQVEPVVLDGIYTSTTAPQMEIGTVTIQKTATRANSPEMAFSDVLSGSEYVTPVIDAETITNEQVGYTRPIRDARLHTMDAAEVPFLETYEHRIYGGSIVREIHATDQLQPDRAIQATTWEATPAPIERVVVFGRTFDGESSAIDTSSEKMTIKPAIVDGLLPTIHDQPPVRVETIDLGRAENRRDPVDAKIDALDTVERFTRYYDAVESDVSKAYVADSWLADRVEGLAAAEIITAAQDARMHANSQADRMTIQDTTLQTAELGDRTVRVRPVVESAPAGALLAPENVGDALEIVLDAAEKSTTLPAQVTEHTASDRNQLAYRVDVQPLQASTATANQYGVPAMETQLEQVTGSQTEFEAVESRMDGADGAPMDVEEARTDATTRKQTERPADFTPSERAAAASRDQAAMITPAERGTRTVRITPVVRTDVHAAANSGNDVSAYLESFISGVREKERDAFSVDTFHAAHRHNETNARFLEALESATRQAIEPAMVSDQLDAGIRLVENDAILSGSLAAAERSDQTAAILDPIESGDRVTVNDAYLAATEGADRRYLDEALFEDWDAAERTIKTARLTTGTTAERIAVNYAERHDFLYGEKTMKSGVLVDADHAIRQDITPAILEAAEGSELIVKKKKKIWLIPARGNHWNSWSGWKKTR